jgi:D-beta-D-heptose 7-phosphate kinase/D-beta-D-heptose 1-phosphate adenosyltransferase
MKTIFVNGTFDVLHIGHICLLNHAKSLGDKLIVAIDSDARVKEKKGETRPVHNDTERMVMLMNIKAVDEVYIFKDDVELESLVQLFEPDIMVVGSDWKGKPIIGSQYAKTVEFFERYDEYSTTKTIQRIIDRR